MLREILTESHGFLDHLLVQLRGVEQVQAIFLPYGKTQVGDVESGLVAGDGNDVAIVNSRTHGFGILHLRLGDEAELLACKALFHLANFRHIFGVRLQGLVALRMLTHLADLNGLYGRKGRIGLLDLRDDARFLILHDPFGEIVDARGIAVDDAITVAHIAKGILISRIGELLAIGTERERRNGLDECGAVELIDIDYKLLIVVDLEGMCHVGYIEEFAGKIKGEVGVGGLLLGIAEEGLDGDAESGLLGIGVIRILGVIGVLRVIGILGRALGGAAVGAGLQGPDEGANGKEQDDM